MDHSPPRTGATSPSRPSLASDTAGYSTGPRRSCHRSSSPPSGHGTSASAALALLHPRDHRWIRIRQRIRPVHDDPVIGGLSPPCRLDQALLLLGSSPVLRIPEAIVGNQLRLRFRKAKAVG